MLKQSKNLKRNLSLLGLVLALSIAIALMVGCSSNTTKYEDQIPVDDKLSFLNESTSGESATASNCLFDVLSLVTSKVIGLAGGVIDFNIDGTDVRFTVSAGALTQPTNITMDVKKIATPVGNLFVYDCGPGGTQFKIDARLSQEMPAGRDKAFLYYFNEENSKWELQQVVSVSNGRATFRIKHFSKYGIS